MTTPLTDEELEKQICDVIKAPMKSQISTADIAVGMMSSTGLGEKVKAIATLIRQDREAREAAARLQEARVFHQHATSRYYGNYSASEQGLMEWHRLFAVERIGQLTQNQSDSKHIDRGNGFTHSADGDCACLSPDAKEDTL